MRKLTDLSHRLLGRSKSRKGSLDLEYADEAQLHKIARFLGSVSLSDHDAAYISYCYEALPDSGKKLAKKLGENAIKQYRESLLGWFSYAIVNRANWTNFKGLNKSLSGFVKDIPAAVLENRDPEFPKFQKSWAFLNADRLQVAGRKAMSVMKADAKEDGLWKEEAEEAVGGIPVQRDKRLEMWFVPYSDWTFQNRVWLKKMGFQANRTYKRWQIKEFKRGTERYFDTTGRMRRPQASPPSLPELKEWYQEKWLPQNIQRFQNIFENYVREEGSKITMTFSVNNKGDVNVSMSRGVTKLSDGIEECRMRYIGAPGRAPWVAVLDWTVKLASTAGPPQKVMFIIDRMNNLEHSNGAFLEKFPAAIRSWYPKFLNAKYSAPTVGKLVKYLSDRDIAEFLKFLANDAWESETYEDLDYQSMGKENVQEINWDKLVPDNKTKPKDKEDPRVQRGLNILRQRGASCQ
jgi:hypothetical protein